MGLISAPGPLHQGEGMNLPPETGRPAVGISSQRPGSKAELEANVCPCRGETGYFLSLPASHQEMLRTFGDLFQEKGKCGKALRRQKVEDQESRPSLGYIVPRGHGG